MLIFVRLYLTNLPEKKINKTELKRALYMLFSTYGPVLDIVTRRMNMRGQAHVVYRDIQTATQAMRALQGFDFFGKEMVRQLETAADHANTVAKKIVYAKGQSQIIPKLRGTFEPPTATTGTAETTDLQRSIFNAPPSSMPTRTTETNGLKPAEASLPEPPHGVKRPRDEEEEAKDVEDEAQDAPMEEDEESDAPMEASSDED